MDPQIIEPDRTDTRRGPRTSLFVMAVMYAGNASAPVKLRDVSAGGALVEGALIPTPGTKISLRRGSLVVTGEVAWQKDGRAGLSFDTRVSVGDWLPSAKVPAAQQRVDEAVQQIKSSMLGRAPGAISLPLESVPVTASELRGLRRAIESLADDLSDDPAVVARHAAALQTLDLAVQILSRLVADRD